ncbi:DNA translocase FtsK [Cytobacillus firmus]|uniref:DNA translocase FtsK n=2 Tax=Cytobacillus TaxID=2675230 RepID=A0A366JXW1_CYTFI|nr:MULTISPECIES: DNA translocase FtsK [Cytobacillus]RBP93817.1 DNA translocase FtsK [Cytobacillus firmus]TDX47769.1 DNA translocase FtsK [Cytobacillus oceanisediminis]
MSWIKKLFHVFKSDEEEYEEFEEHADEPNYEKQPTSKRTKESSRDIDAKVVYQYPKGQFRFPVIPDHEAERENKRQQRQDHNRQDHNRGKPVNKTEKRKSRAGETEWQKKPVDTPIHEKRSPRSADRERQRKAAPAPASEEKILTRNEREAASKKRPFQPTEIPSPIYGFKRPRPNAQKDNSDNGEQEYNHRELTYDEVMRKIQQTPPNRPKVTDAVSVDERETVISDKQKAFQAQASALETEEPAAKRYKIGEASELMFEVPEDYQKTEQHEEAHPAWQDHKEPARQLGSSRPDDESPSSEDRIGHKKESEISRSLANLIEEALHEEEKEEYTAELSGKSELRSHAILEIEAEKDAEKNEFHNDLGIDAKSDSEKFIHINLEEGNSQAEGPETPDKAELSSDPEDSGEITGSFSSQAELISDTNRAEDAEEKQTADINECLETETKSTASTPQQEENVQEEKNSSSRGSIPFNVIMLNNDRKKLNQQDKMARPSDEKKNNIAMFPPENIQQSAAAAEKIEDHPPKNHLPMEEPAEQSPPASEMDRFEDKQTYQDDEEIFYYQFPSQTLLTSPVIMEEASDWLYEQEQMLNSTLQNFNVRARVVNVTQGPSVTRFEVQPEPGVKVNKITNLSDDIKLSLAARDIRIEAPIPGKHTIGIEVPNQRSRPVFISEIISTPEFQTGQSPLTAVLGLDISGKPIVTDLRKMPHGLIAGATGSGKSVCINTILVSLLYKASPDELKLLLIDPKMVELAPYNRIPHLVSPVITDVKAATAALKWAVEEMERRYELFAHAGVRDINRFNELAEEHQQYSEKLPFMVIVIDELADLMMMSPADVEEAICRIAQKARACGIHLIIATQRPSVDVITGLIKANVPTRIAFSVSSQIDSRTIIDISGAEKLLGRGDMLFLENGSSKPVRLQGTFVSDKEIDDVVAHVRRERDPDYLFEQEELLKKAHAIEEEDELFFEACEFVVDQGAASTSSLQRRFKIGYNRAARLIDMMEKQGFISENRGSKPRDVLITEADLESIQETSTLN